MAGGPTTGASEREWRASPATALAIRAVVLLVPVAAAYVAVRALADVLYRPFGIAGLLAWIAQATVVGLVVAKLADRLTRRLLPLAAMFELSLVFPDRAPSRFGVALRSGSVRQLQKRIDEVRRSGLGRDEQEAARSAIELVSALGHHDRLTRGHTERVRAYADLIGEELDLAADDRWKLTWGVLLHDVGKITVPPEILNKDGRPTEEEWVILSGHPAAGQAMLAPLADWLGDWVRAAGEHHERWDGTGYPAGLAGAEISLAGRIAAVADAYDVITSKRSYKVPMSSEAARRELVRCSGSQFDPAVVRAFLNVSLGRRRNLGPLAWLGDSSAWTLASASSGNHLAASVGAAVALGSAMTGVGPSAAPGDGSVPTAATEPTTTLPDTNPPSSEPGRAPTPTTSPPTSTPTAEPSSTPSGASTTTAPAVRTTTPPPVPSTPPPASPDDGANEERPGGTPTAPTTSPPTAPATSTTLPADPGDPVGDVTGTVAGTVENLAAAVSGTVEDATELVTSAAGEVIVPVADPVVDAVGYVPGGGDTPPPLLFR